MRKLNQRHVGSCSVKPSGAGFTLIELVIAISILGLILTVAYGALNQIVRSKRLLDQDRDLHMITNAVLGRLTRELQLATAEAKLLPPADNLQKKYASSSFMLGQPRKLSNGESGDSITFMANDAGQYVPDGLTHAGVVQISYRVETDPEQPESNIYYLIRDEVPAVRPEEKAYKQVMTFPITKRVVALEFRYFADEQWLSEWSEEQKGLPELIRFTLKLQGASGKIETYNTVVPISRHEE